MFALNDSSKEINSLRWILNTNPTKRIMQVITFPTTLHGERVWGYFVRHNGMIMTEGFGITKEHAEQMAKHFIETFSTW